MARRDVEAMAKSLPDSNPASRLLSNTLVQFLPPGLRVALGIILVAALSRYLGPEGFGQFALVFAYVAVFNGIFNNWGLGTILLREISRRPGERSTLLLSGAALQAAIATVSYGLMLLSLLILDYPAEVDGAVALYGLSILLAPIDMLALSFQADLRLLKLLPASLLGVGLNFGLILLVILLEGSLLALAGATLAALVFQYAWIGRMSLPAFGRPSLTCLPPVLREAWPLGVATVLTTAAQQAPILILSWFSLGATGLFSAANRIPQQLVIVPLAVRNSTFPLLSQSWVTDRPQFRQRLERLVKASLLLAVPTAIFGVGITESLIQFIFGPTFTGASTPFRLLLCATLLLFPGILVGEALTAAGFQRVNLLIQALSLPVLLVLLLVLAPDQGATGAAWAVLLSSGLIVFLTFVAAEGRLGGIGLRPVVLPAVIAVALGGGILTISAPIGPVTSSILAALAASLTMIKAWPVQAFELWSLRPQRLMLRSQ